MSNVLNLIIILHLQVSSVDAVVYQRSYVLHLNMGDFGILKERR